MAVSIAGVDELEAALQEIEQRIHRLPNMVAEQLEDGMRRYAHVITGYLRSTVYSRGNVAGADAPYAAEEALRGGTHDFPTLAIEALDMDEIADHIVEPF